MVRGEREEGNGEGRKGRRERVRGEREEGNGEGRKGRREW